MRGYTIPCFGLRTLNFGVGGIGVPQEVILADMVDVLYWRQVVLELRVHAHTLAGHANTVTISVYGQSVSAQDPGLLFLDRVGAKTLLLDTNTPVPGYLIMHLGETHAGDGLLSAAPMVRVTATLAQGDSAATSVTLSADLSVKDQ